MSPNVARCTSPDPLRGRRAQLRTADLDQWLSALSMRWNLLKHRVLVPLLFSQGWGPRIGISSKFLVDTNAAGVETTF